MTTIAILYHCGATYFFIRLKKIIQNSQKRHFGAKYQKSGYWLLTISFVGWAFLSAIALAAAEAHAVFLHSDKMLRNLATGY
jgi:hypothetical protein